MGARTTRPPAAEKTGLPTTKGREKHSNSQKILHIKGSLTVRATQGQQGNRQTHTTFAPTSPKETKDLTQSSYYRLWGPGFLDVSLVLEQQELATAAQPPLVPAQTMATSGMNQNALASLQADELQNLIESLQGLAESRQEETTPTQQPPVHASTPAEEEEIRWEQVGTGRLPVAEAPHA